MAIYDCQNSNWNEDVYCTPDYNPFDNDYCTDGSYTKFNNYINQVANVQTPSQSRLNAIQVLWQLSASSINTSGPVT